MSKQSYRYPRDEFDNTPEDSPVGVHRVPRSAWHKLVPFVVVAAVFAVVAYVGVTWWADGFGGDSSASADDKPAVQTTAPAKSTATKAATKATSEPTDEADDSSDTSSAEVDHSIAVAVKNPPTGVAGAAAVGAKTLTNDGFTSVTAVTYTGTPPAVPTVYYKTAAEKDTADAVAKLLQIDTVTKLSSVTTPITVVLAPKS